MPQRILIEVLLFSIPFALFLVYRLGSREVSVRDRWPLKVLSAVGAGIAIVGLLIWPLLEGSNHGLCTEFARYDRGVTTPPKQIPCAAGGAPTGPVTPIPQITDSVPEEFPVEPPQVAPEPTGRFTPPNGGLNPG
jgi:hypothetical protein